MQTVHLPIDVDSAGSINERDRGGGVQLWVGMQIVHLPISGCRVVLEETEEEEEEAEVVREG